MPYRRLGGLPPVAAIPAPSTTSTWRRRTIPAAATFVDTSGLYAVLDRDDGFHQRAATSWRSLVEQNAALLTQSYVLLELVALAQRRLGMDAVRALSDDLLPLVRVVWVDEALHEMGMTALRAAAERDISLVDWISFEVMRQRGVAQAFGFDSHFRDHGFTLLPEARR